MRFTQLSAQPNQSLNILITGFVVVFAVLILLIGVIKLYSGIVYSAQQKAEKKAKAKAEKNAQPAKVPTPASAPVSAQPSSTDPDLQTVAVITAAVQAYYGDSDVRVTGITPVSSTRSEWATAGVIGNISLRSEGLF